MGGNHATHGITKTYLQTHRKNFDVVNVGQQGHPRDVPVALPCTAVLLYVIASLPLAFQTGTALSLTVDVKPVVYFLSFHL